VPAITRSWRLVLALFMAGAFPTAAGPHSVHAARPAPTIRRFVLPAKVDGPPAVAGNALAWVTQPGLCHPKAAPSTCNLASYLHLADIRSFHPHTLVRFSNLVSSVIALLSQHHLVWMSTRYPFGGWWVWSRDLRTGRKTLIDSSQAEVDRQLRRPASRSRATRWPGPATIVSRAAYWPVYRPSPS